MGVMERTRICIGADGRIDARLINVSPESIWSRDKILNCKCKGIWSCKINIVLLCFVFLTAAALYSSLDQEKTNDGC